MVVVVDDDGGIKWRRRGGRSMAVVAFDGNGDGLRLIDGEAKMAIDTSGGGWRKRASAFDGGDGWRFALLWTTAVVAVNDRDGVQWWRWRWRWQRLTATAMDCG